MQLLVLRTVGFSHAADSCTRTAQGYYVSCASRIPASYRLLAGSDNSYMYYYIYSKQHWYVVTCTVAALMLLVARADREQRRAVLDLNVRPPSTPPH